MTSRAACRFVLSSTGGILAWWEAKGWEWWCLQRLRRSWCSGSVSRNHSETRQPLPKPLITGCLHDSAKHDSISLLLERNHPDTAYVAGLMQTP